MFYSPSERGFYEKSIHGNKIPKDAIEITESEHQDLMQAQAEGKVIDFQNGRPVAIDPPPPTKDQIISSFRSGIQRRLDMFAETRNYDNAISACSYANSTVQKFAAEGQRMIELRDATWSAAYELLGKFESGEIEQPSFDDVIAVLPELTWPE